MEESNVHSFCPGLPYLSGEIANEILDTRCADMNLTEYHTGITKDISYHVCSTRSYMNFSGTA